MKQNKNILLVTTGDADGIGLEVTTKALLGLPGAFLKRNHICVFVSNAHQRTYLNTLKKNFASQVLNLDSKDFSLDSLGLDTRLQTPQLFLIVATDSPADWIFHLSKVCQRNPKRMALVTAPLSKTLIKDAGYSAIGHTEIMAQATGVDSLFMGFVGKYFNVALLTGHIPLHAVSSKLRALDWDHALKTMTLFGNRLKNRKGPIALVAVNPHAGEKGMISTGEEEFLIKQIKPFSNKIVGPLVPDAAFLKQNWKKYRLFLACYHDQGLIPFKAIHGQDSGVHVTLGLPFIRTSVDHGTAKEIFGKNSANPNSMKESLLLACELLSAQLKRKRS